MTRLTTPVAAAAAAASLLLLTTSPLASAHLPPVGQPGPHNHIQARAPTSSASHAASTGGGSGGSGGQSAPAGATGTANIVATPISETPSALPTAVVATKGSPPPTGVIKGAPPIPTGTPLPANYPPLDKVPDTNSPEVQAWLKQIDLSKVPNIPPTVLGGCPANPQAVANAGETGTCWWTCGHCTRETDVTFCPDKGDWGLSYDDGPASYTSNLLDYLDSKNIKSTFFVVGSRALSRPDLLLYEYVDGHQLSVHTWSHPTLTTLTNEQIVAEFGWSKKIIKDITGVTPNTMRPPFGDIDDRVRFIAEQMGLTPIIWTTTPSMTFDTQDWQIPAGTVNLSTVTQNFNTILNGASQMSSGFILLEHDLFQQTVDIATEIVLPQALTQNLNLKPIISCLKQDLAQAYIETASNATGSFGNPSVLPSGSSIGASATMGVPGLSQAKASAGATASGRSGSGGSNPAPSSGSGSGSNSAAGRSARVAAGTMVAGVVVALGVMMGLVVA